MEFLRLDRIRASFAKYKYVWLVLLIGILLMMIPSRSQTAADETEAKELSEETEDTEEKLEIILSKVSGAGEVKVMLSVAQGEQTIYQTDTSYSQSEDGTDSRTQTILITDKDRNEAGLVHQKNPPKYLGAIVLSQGADDPVVKLSIVDAVGKVTGLGADKIAVLRME